MGAIKYDVMRRAWDIFKSGHSFYSSGFDESLRRAWEVEKANIRHEEEQRKIAIHEKWYRDNKEDIDRLVLTDYYSRL